ncbi:MAG: RND family transporter [bacterium]|nr:RND family transporter [bacterium]
MSGLSDIIRKVMVRISKLQQRFFVVLLIGMLIFTAVLGIGWTKLHFESDFEKFNPEGPPITELTGDVDKDFGSYNNVIVAVQLDDSVDSRFAPTDIRDPEIVDFLIRLDKNLREDTRVQDVFSIGSFFKETPEDLDEVKEILGRIPDTEGLVSKDYSFTTAIVRADVGADSKKIKDFSDKVDEIIKYSSPPAGVKTVTTGDAPLGATIFNLIISDAIKTSIIALIFIFFMLLFIQRSFKDALVILIPLMVGISWVFSSLGFLGISINVGTAGLSAMLIGLGVEYNIFLVSRFREEIRTKELNPAIQAALSNIGTAIMSSGGTTAIGFFALSMSIFPILQGLGQSLGIGILSMFGSTILVTPLVLIIQEKISPSGKYTERGFSMEKIFRGYGKAVSKMPIIFILLAVVILVFMMHESSDLNQQDMSFENMLPEDNEAMHAYFLIQNEFGSTQGVSIYVELDPSDGGTDEPVDMRDHRVLSYIDILTQKAKASESVVRVSSISKVAKERNEGVLPKTIASNQHLFQGTSRLMSQDYRISLIKIDVSENIEQEEVVRQLEEIVAKTEQPAGVNSVVIGGLAVGKELDSMFGPDSNRTSIIALLGIIIFLFLLSFSFRGTFLPLFTVVLAVMWTMGLIGLLQIPFNNITSSVITMTIGIGIDFGIQIWNRFRYEMRSHDKQKAMENTLTHVLKPMAITVIAAVIGFRAMFFGELNIMGDLGTTMSLAMIASMFAAITGVAGVMVLTQGKKRTT